MLTALLGATCLLLVVLSILQRRKIRALGHDKQAFRTLAENSPDPIIRYDRQGRRLYLNPAIVGLLTGRSSADGPLLDSGQGRQLVDGIRRVFETGETGGVEIAVTDSQGRRHSYNMLLTPERGMGIIANPEREADGGVLWYGMQLDITERKPPQDELLYSQDFLDRVIDASPDPIFVKDRQHRWILVNEAFCRLLGGTREDLIGKSDFDFFPEDEARVCQEGDERVFANGKELSREEEITIKGGEKRRVLIRKTTFNDAHGKPNLAGVITDVTERKRMELQLIARERELRSIMENIPDNIARFSPDGRAVYLNRLSEHVAERQRESLLGRTPTECFPDGRFADYERRILTTAATGARDEIEMALPMPDGTTQYHLTRFLAERDENGAVVSVLTIGIDISERRRAEEKLRLAASVFTNTHDGVVVTDANNRIIDVNAAFVQITGYARDEVIGKNPSLLSSRRQSSEFYAEMWRTLGQTGHWTGELWNQRKNGEVYADRLSISVVKDDQGRVSHYVGLFADITQTKEHERQLKRIAHHDALTGLPNRLLFMDRLKQAVAQTRRAGGLLGVCYGDLDGFKPVNDQFGHEAGDQLLVKIAGRMKESVRTGDSVARFGGDEFVLLLVSIESAEECETILTRLLDSIAQPVWLAGHSVSVTASIGVALFPQDDVDPDTLLQHADQAMYQAKQDGKNACRFYAPDRP